MTEAEIVYRIFALYKQVHACNHINAIIRNYEIEINRLNYKLFNITSKLYFEYTKKEIEELMMEHILLGS